MKGQSSMNSRMPALFIGHGNPINAEFVEKGDHRSLVQYEEQGAAALLSIPTPDHYWPLLYILGAIDNGDSITYPIDGIVHCSVSMRSIAFGL